MANQERTRVKGMRIYDPVWDRAVELAHEQNTTVTDWVEEFLSEKTGVPLDRVKTGVKKPKKTEEEA